ncbi:serine/threonine-protein kinase [Streptomyces fragilis]|uniref:Protein kinase n=1 Tax=Streptomyces fragilis TaxID=67301 RepID=A0ABV2YFA1_9ACTN|nr:serine/threonine-protein kinase [Streptomyces fragilis]
MNGAGISADGMFKALEADDPTAVGGYRLTARLGAGGMGKVYLSHTPGGRPVALKVIRPEFAEDPEFRRRFAQEVRAAERVQGLYTAPVIDSDTQGPRPWLATAYVPGPTLASAVAEHGPLPAATVLLLTAGVAEALQVVHGAGIVHRDLKPSNVLLAGDGPRVIDFGIARAADSTALTGSGVTVGTPAFMSPEQAAGRTVGPRSDVFALGQVAAFAALGRAAHGEGPSHAVLYRIVHEEADLTGLPGELDELVRRCLAKDEQARPSLTEVLALCSAASDLTQLRRPEDWLPGPLTTAINRHYAAPAPLPSTGPGTAPAGESGRSAAPEQHPVTAPDLPRHPPTAVSAGLQAPATPPAGSAYAPTGTAPAYGSAPHTPHAPHTPAPAAAAPGHGPTAAAPAYGPTVTAPAYGAGPGTPAHGASPTPPPAHGSGWPAGPSAPGVTGPPPRRRRAGVVLGVLGGVLALAVAALAGYLGRGDAPSTDAGPKRTGAAAASGGATAPADPRDGTPREATTPDPEVHKGVNLPEGYHLVFSDEPLAPRYNNKDDLYFGCSFTDCHLGHYTTELVLLDKETEGSLEACKADTRFLPQTISVDRLSRGRQLCATTRSGLIALVTFVGRSPSSSSSHYVTLDVTVWRDAVPVEDS